MAATKLFVYGLMKQGQPYHEALLADPQQRGPVRRLGQGRTVDAYPLVIASDHHFPVMLAARGKGCRVHGDVFEVDMARIKAQNVNNHYITETIPVEMPDGSVQQCHVMLVQNFRPELLSLKCWDNYEHAGDHGLRFPTGSPVHLPDYIDKAIKQIKM